MSLSSQVAWIVERNLTNALDLDDLAARCGVSRFHLAHAFAAATGDGLMSYVRGRRLTEAARRLAADAPDILDLALETGYGSHKAFTRAFRERLGATPDEIKKRRSLAGLPLVKTYQSDPMPITLNAPREERRDVLVFVGIAAVYRFGEEARIPGQWSQFMSVAAIESKADPIPWGVYRDADGESFRYLAGYLVDRGAVEPRGMEKWHVAPRDYRVFRHTDHVSQLGATYAALWNEWLPQSGLVLAEPISLEQHAPTFDPQTGLGGVDIWIPVAKR